MTVDRIRVDSAKLESLVAAYFEHLGMSPEHARISANTLVDSDLRGHESHGVSNFIRVLYAPGLKDGTINPRGNPHIVHETSTTARWDADGAMGHAAGELAMADAIERARQHGSGFATVRNSRHYGMAQHFSMMALPHDMIGFSMTVGGLGVSVTGGRGRCTSRDKARARRHHWGRGLAMMPKPVAS